MASLSFSDQNVTNFYILIVPIATSFLGTFVTNNDSRRIKNWEKLVYCELFSRVNLAFASFYFTMLILVTYNGKKSSGSFMLVMSILSLGFWLFTVHVGKEASKHLDFEEKKEASPNEDIHETNPNDKVKNFLVKYVKEIIWGIFSCMLIFAVLVSFSDTTNIENKPTKEQCEQCEKMKVESKTSEKN